MCVCVCVCVCVVRVSVFVFHILLYVNCFGRTVLYMYTEYSIKVIMYLVSAQGVDKCTLLYTKQYYNSPLQKQHQKSTTNNETSKNQENLSAGRI